MPKRLCRRAKPAHFSTDQGSGRVTTRVEKVWLGRSSANDVSKFWKRPVFFGLILSRGGDFANVTL